MAEDSGRAARKSIRGAARGSLLVVATTLPANLATGVLAARFLAPSGRGQLAALLTIATITGWLGAWGARQAASYFVASDKIDAGDFLRTWFALLLASSIPIGVGGEFLLPTLLHAQSRAVLADGRVFFLVFVPVAYAELYGGILLAQHRYGAWNWLRLWNPLSTLAGYGLLYALSGTDLVGALGVNAVSYMGMPIGAAWLLAEEFRQGRWRLDLVRDTVAFGAKAHVASLSDLTAQRLDLTIMPALLASTQIGYYAVATSAGAILIAVGTQLSAIVLPAAAARGNDGERLVARVASGTLAISCLGAAAAFVSSPWLVPAVYGANFSHAVAPLKLLMPGAVLLPVGQILAAGLAARGLAFLSSVPQVVAALVTVIGLAAFLKGGGIDAAAVVSSVAYGLMFLTAVTISWVVRRPPDVLQIAQDTDLVTKI